MGRVKKTHIYLVSRFARSVQTITIHTHTGPVSVENDPAAALSLTNVDDQHQAEGEHGYGTPNDGGARAEEERHRKHLYGGHDLHLSS